MRRSAVFLLVLAGAGGLSDQAAAQRDVQPVFLRGQVLAEDDSAAPLRRARVRVIDSAEAIAPVFTDGDGRFAVAVRAPYRLEVTKAGFAPAVVTGPPSAATDLRVRLARGAAIAGVVIDQAGFPVAGAVVRARRLDFPSGSAPPIERTTETDEAGEYRIGSLADGRYALHTERPHIDVMSHRLFIQQQVRQQAERLDAGLNAAPVPPMSEVIEVEARSSQVTPVTLVHGARAVLPPDAPIAGAIAGTVYDEFGEPVEGATVQLSRLRYVADRYVMDPPGVPRRTDDLGRYRLFHVIPGRYLLSVTLDVSRFTPVYFPAGTTIASATPIVLARRQQLSGIHVSFTHHLGARVFGFAVNARGEPLQGTISLTPSRRSGAVGLPARMVSVASDGRFEFLNVAPGEYALVAIRSRVDPVAGLRERLAAAAAAGTDIAALERLVRDAGAPEVAMQFVTIGGAYVPPLTIQTMPPATLSGRVLVDGFADGVAIEDVGLTAIADADYVAVEGRAPFTLANADGTFELHGLFGRTRIALRAPPGVWLKDVNIAGINAAESPVVFGGPNDSRTDVTVIVSGPTAAVSGRVVDDAGESPDDYRVVVFSTNRDRWRGGSSYVQIARGPEVDGGFRVRSLPPDDYFIAALDGIEGDAEAGEWQNPDVLSSLALTATRASLTQGQQAEVQLRVLRWPR